MKRKKQWYIMMSIGVLIVLVVSVMALWPKNVSTDVNGVLRSESIRFETFPQVVLVSLEDATEYSVSYSADAPIRFTVYNEQRYNEWKETGRHTLSKASTKSQYECCKSSATFAFEVNDGEGGQYYLVFDDNDLGDGWTRPTQAVVSVTKKK